MSLQHSTGQSETQGEAKGRAEQEGIVVPLDLGGLRILKQALQEDGSIAVEVIATTDRARCPHCQRVSVKVHDTRPRRKRDMALRGHRIVLVLLKRRFRCPGCRRSFTEADQACGNAPPNACESTSASKPAVVR
jgi:transposase